MIIIIDIINVLFKHHDQDMISFDVMISFLESNIHMSFESVVSSTFIVFTEFAQLHSLCLIKSLATIKRNLN